MERKDGGEVETRGGWRNGHDDDEENVCNKTEFSYTYYILYMKEMSHRARRLMTVVKKRQKSRID